MLWNGPTLDRQNSPPNLINLVELWFSVIPQETQKQLDAVAAVVDDAKHDAQALQATITEAVPYFIAELDDPTIESLTYTREGIYNNHFTEYKLDKVSFYNKLLQISAKRPILIFLGEEANVKLRGV